MTSNPILKVITIKNITQVCGVSRNNNLIVVLNGVKCLIKGKLFNQLSMITDLSVPVALCDVEGFDLPLIKTLKF